jgi:hypothetical protein
MEHHELYKMREANWNRGAQHMSYRNLLIPNCRKGGRRFTSHRQSLSQYDMTHLRPRYLRFLFSFVFLDLEGSQILWRQMGFEVVGDLYGSSDGDGIAGFCCTLLLRYTVVYLQCTCPCANFRELSAWPRYVQTTVREHEHAYCTGLLMLTGSLAAYWNRTFVVLQRLRGRC